MYLSISIFKNAAVKDATPAQVLAHIAQLKPYLQANKDVILGLQAGLIGVWGEYWLLLFLNTLCCKEVRQIEGKKSCADIALQLAMLLEIAFWEMLPHEYYQQCFT